MATKKTPNTKSEPALRILRRRYFAQPYTTMLSQLQMQVASQNEMLDRNGWTGRRVMGFRLPAWQRQSKWSLEQSQRFIESIWIGVGLGTYMVNHCLKNPDADLVLLDGQQRMRAIEQYLNSEFPMRGEDGIEYLWKDLTDEEQAHFLRIPFPWNSTEYSKDDDLREAYNRHNFGGVAHDESERA